ncbi:MAG: lysylphosphatidylglycerol synthase transmembrane domain-containing protein [Planctomycetota bacterium]
MADIKTNSDLPPKVGRSPSKRSWKERLPWKTIFRLVVFAAAVFAVGWMVYQSADQLREHPIRLSEIGWQWWVLAVLSYTSAMLLSNLFWYRILKALGQNPKPLDCVAAFFASQLGKYIPGKAMVVVIRTDMIRGDRVDLKPAIASVFVETLTWIFVGSVIASVLMLLLFREQTVLQIVAIGLMIGAGVLTWPPFFRRIAGKLSSLGSGKKSAKVFSGLTFGTMAFGWIVMTIGWCLNGLSLALVVQGIPGINGPGAGFLLCLACVSLATVAGFVSLLPGGVGVRELVIIPLLGPVIGPAMAIVAAVVIRLVWLSSELSTAGIIYLYRFSIRTKS